MASLRVIALSLSLVFLACGSGPCDSGADPLEDLRCTEAGSSYGPDFWAPEAEADSELWQAAQAICSEFETPSVNRCRQVAQVEMVLELRRHAGEARRRFGAAEEQAAPPRFRPSKSPPADEGFTGIPPGLPDPAETTEVPPDPDDGS